MLRIVTVFLTTLLVQCSIVTSQDEITVIEDIPQLLQGKRPVENRAKTLPEQLGFRLSATAETEARQITFQLVQWACELERTTPGTRASQYVIQEIQSTTQLLRQNAEMRIPLGAKEVQRAKLERAAQIDIRRAIIDIRRCCATKQRAQVRDISYTSKFDIFGEGSLFDKVMRQEGLKLQANKTNSRWNKG